MKFSIDWLDDAENAAPEERATVARFVLCMGEQNVTQHLAGSEASGHLTLSLYSLVQGLAHDWWLLFGGRDRVVRLMRHRGGYALPDIRMRFDGSAFEIEAAQVFYKNPDVRFWGGMAEVLSRQDAEACLTGLVKPVLDRLEDKGVKSTAASLRWSRVEASRADPDEAAFCEAAGALGKDPYSIDRRSATLIEQSGRLFKGEALIEFLAGLSPQSNQVLDWIQTSQTRRPFQSGLPDLKAVAREAADAAPEKIGERSWSLGYRRARAARKVLDLGRSHSLKGIRDLTTRLGNRTFELAPAVDGIRALREDRSDAIHVHLRRQGENDVARTDHTFALGRAVGDAVCFPKPSRAVINDLHDALRQAAGRAFSAEFFAPAEDVDDMRRDGKDVATIATEFGVSTAVIERQLENVGRVREACSAG